MEQIVEYAIYIGPDGKEKLQTEASYPIRIYIFNGKIVVVAQRSHRLRDFAEIPYDSMLALLQDWNFNRF